MARQPKPFEDEDTLDLTRTIPADAVALGGSINTAKAYFVRNTIRYATAGGVCTYFAGSVLTDPAVIKAAYAAGATLEPTT